MQGRKSSLCNTVERSSKREVNTDSSNMEVMGHLMICFIEGIKQFQGLRGGGSKSNWRGVR